MDTEIAIVGGGFSGIGAAILLDRAGFSDLQVLEAGDGIGGAWHWNTYPGISVDIPSFSYQFSFAQRTDWSRIYAPGDELKAYAEWCVDEFGLRERIRLNTTVTAGRWDDERHLWEISVQDGPPIEARHVVSATGVFSQPKLPAIPGVETFAGDQLHTSRWDHSISLAGRRVGIIGTGASAVQVIPAIAKEVERLTVFQRTPIWCLPKMDGRLREPFQKVLRRVPGARSAVRLASEAFVELTFPIVAHYNGIVPLSKLGERQARAFLRDQVHDPRTRRKLTPRYALGCKRPSFHNEYLSTFNRPNVSLVTDAIERISETAVHTADGAAHELDVLILATGFKVFETGNMPPYQVTGREGRDLEGFWAENRFQAYEGVSVPGFPNAYSILGPYAFNGSSYFNLIETQSRHIVRALKEARRRGATSVEVRREANDRYFAEMLRRRRHQVFWQESCGAANSYYFDAHGDVPLRPSTTLEGFWRAARFPLEDYEYRSLAGHGAAVAAGVGATAG